MGKSFASFVFAIGTKDDYSGMDSCRYAIALDGITVLSGEVSHGQRPLRKVIDVRGKRSLRIELQSSVALGEPTLSYNYIPPTDGNAGGNGDPAPRFAASAGEAIIEDGTVKLRWDKSPGATAYGVLVVLDNPSGGSSRERMWSYTTGRLPEQNILVKELPKGSFLWYVVPLSEGKSLSRPMPMGDFKI